MNQELTSELAAKYAAIISSEHQLSGAFENAVIGLGLTNVQGQWVRVNRTLCELLGYTAEELLSKNFRDVTYSEDLTAGSDSAQRLLSDQAQVVHFEKRYVHKLGNTIWVHVSLSLVRDQNGIPLNHIVQVQDISKRKGAESELRESRDLFRVVSEVMPQMVWMTLPDGRNIYFSHRWVEYTGLSLEESAGHNWVKPFHPDDRKRAQEAWAAATSSNEEYSIECRLRKHDGTYRWWLIKGLPQYDDLGKVFRWIGNCTDVNDLKSALEKAQAYEETIAEQAKLISLAKDAIILKDLDGRVKFWNEGAERMYGWTSKEAMGQKSIDLFAEDLSKHQESLQGLLKNGHWEGTFKQRTLSGGKISVETRWTLSKDSYGNPKSILSIGTDITEKEKAQTQAYRAQRLESLGTLAGGIAHDLNNVLAPIMMSIELLKLGETSQERLGVLDTIDGCSRRGADMIKNVLSFARGVEGERNEIQPGQLVKEIEKIVGDTFLKSVQVKVKLPSTLWTISGDHTQLHQVLLNLCVNARDAMVSAGILTLSAENVTIDEQTALLRGGCDPGTYVLIAIEDTGMGMPKEILDRLFEPFFTTKELGKGTGLDLSTSLTIVKSHGGFIRVYSDEGRGTRFDVYLPTSKKDTSLAAAGAIVADQLPRGAQEWILVIDDEAAVRQITRQTLETFGYRVSVASGGPEAIEIYGKRKTGLYWYLRT